MAPITYSGTPDPRGRAPAAANCCSIRAMTKTLTIASTLLLGSALALSACGKDKKPATAEPATAEPAKPDPAKTDPAAAKPDDKTAGKPADKPAGGGW
jgi:hypothetical protein